MRAQHWALRNFMNKQLEKIQKTNIKSEDELNVLLNEDSSNCCPRKKRKSVVKPPLVPQKRPPSNGVSMQNQPPAKKPTFAAIKPIKLPIQANYHLTKPGPKPGGATIRPASSKNDEIVCTPDILGMFNENDGSKSQKQVQTNAPPPLILRQNQVNSRPPLTQANPIYHTGNKKLK
jgi:hypothetical protein